MKRLVLLAMLSTAALWPSGASGAPYDAWLDNSRVPTPTLPLEIIEAQCPRLEVPASCVTPIYSEPEVIGVEGCITVAPQQFECGAHAGDVIYSDRELTGLRVWMLPAEAHGPRARVAFLHEIGHAVDIERITEGERLRLARLLRVTSWPNPLINDQWNASAERFAWRYSKCARGERARLSRAAFRRFCAALRNVA